MSREYGGIINNDASTDALPGNTVSGKCIRPAGAGGNIRRFAPPELTHIARNKE